MKYLKYFAVIFSVIMSLGGAVNSGFSGVFLAVPFMVYLVYIGYKVNKYLFITAILFIIFCITVNKTQDFNHFIYPILKDGNATVLQDGYQKTYLNLSGIGGSGGFDISSTTIRCIGCGEVRVTPLRSGEVYKVIGVYHDNGDFADKVGVVTEIGQFTYSNTDPSGFRYAINLNKPIQSASVLFTNSTLPPIL